MHDPDLEHLRGDLLRAGIAAACVDRAVAELADHFDDIRDDALVRDDPEVAEDEARSRLGSADSIVAHYRCRPELLRWSHRHPEFVRIACIVSGACEAPAALALAGVRHAPLIARWITCSALAGLVTAALLLAMQLSILFG